MTSGCSRRKENKDDVESQMVSFSGAFFFFFFFIGLNIPSLGSYLSC